MPRKMLLTLLGIATLCFCWKSLPAEAGEVKIGFISLKKVSAESLKQKAFEQKIKKLLAEKKVIRDGIKKEIADLETAKALSGPEQAKVEEQKIQQKKVELLKFDNKLRREIDKMQSVFEKEILQDIAEAVGEVAKERGYNWVLMDEILLYKDESADLTFQALVKMNDKYLAARSKPETKPEQGSSPAGKPPAMSASGEDALINDVLNNGARDRYTIKQIQPRAGSPSGSITMKSEAGHLRFISQYAKDMSPGTGAIVAPPMGNKSVWRFVGKTSLSGYTFEGADEKRPLTFILLDKTGLVHLYGRGSVILPDGQKVGIEEAAKK